MLLGDVSAARRVAEALNFSAPYTLSKLYFRPLDSSDVRSLVLIINFYDDYVFFILLYSNIRLGIQYGWTCKFAYTVLLLASRLCCALFSESVIGL